VWLAIYYLFLVVSCILMLNLLIAMLSHTFEEVKSEATRESRLSFATEVMKLELFARSLRMTTRVGEHTDAGSYVYRFRSSATVQPVNFDGGDAEEAALFAANPFAPPQPTQLSAIHELLKRVDDRMSSLETREKVLWTAPGVVADQEALHVRPEGSFHPRGESGGPGKDDMPKAQPKSVGWMATLAKARASSKTPTATDKANGLGQMNRTKTRSSPSGAEQVVV